MTQVPEWEGILVSTPAQWREASRIARKAAANETDPKMRVLWASHALALAELAEQVERREKAEGRKKLVA